MLCLYIDVLYSDKTWVFDQSERAQGTIYIIIINKCTYSTIYTYLLLQGGGWMSPDGARPGSSGSTKEEDFRFTNGMVPHSFTNGTVPHSHLTNGWFFIIIVINSWLFIPGCTLDM